MGLRIISAFAAFVGVSWLLTGLRSGNAQDILAGLAIALVAGAMLWRSLRNPAVTRSAGLRATVSFALQPGAGVAPKGTYTRIKTHRGNWDAALDRMPERGDFESYGSAFRGWVWLDEAGLPQRVRINYANTWKSWPVLSAVPVSTQEGP